MSEVKIFLKSKRKPIVALFENIELAAQILHAMNEEQALKIGDLIFSTSDISYIAFNFDLDKKKS